jgi:hypothetical protein
MRSETSCIANVRRALENKSIYVCVLDFLRENCVHRSFESAAADDADDGDDAGR